METEKLVDFIKDIKVKNERSSLAKLATSGEVSQAQFRTICRVRHRKLIEQGLLKDNTESS